jgi:asparagine synthase (glutamine-hydrolysing)
VCFAFATPDASKVAGGVTKRLLREAVRGLVPEPIRQRTDKVGYNAPVREWLGGGLADWAWDQVNDPEFLRSELWDGRALRDAVRTQRASGRQWIHEQAHRVLLAVSAHLWQTRWLSSGHAGAAQAGG